MKEFKLDTNALHAAFLEDFEDDCNEDFDPADMKATAELSRQLTAAGGPPGDLETQLRTLLALTADLEGLHKQIESEESARHKLLDQLEAERKAHAETQRELGRMVLDAQNALLAEQRLHGKTCDVAQAWQSATGHASPESYRASRVEPWAGVVDTLVNVFTRALVLSPRNGDDAGAHRACVAALAEMGAEALPSVDDVRDWIVARGGAYSTDHREGASMMRAEAAPILAAKDARIAELEAKADAASRDWAADVAARDEWRLRALRAESQLGTTARPIGIPDPPPPPPPPSMNAKPCRSSLLQLSCGRVRGHEGMHEGYTESGNRHQWHTWQQDAQADDK